MDQFRILAQRLDGGEKSVVAGLVLMEDHKLACLGGPFGEMLKQITRAPIPALRMCFVSLDVAARLVGEEARKQAIDIGDRFGMTGDELADLYKTPH
jgi:hypothetical protein